MRGIHYSIAKFAIQHGVLIPVGVKTYILCPRSVVPDVERPLYQGMFCFGFDAEIVMSSELSYGHCE
jgi:hypothetical protein